MTEIKDKIERVSVDKIIKYHQNPKAHPDEQVDKIASSIKNYGFDQPIVVDSENEIIKGHGRLEAAKKLGLEQVPVIKQGDLSEAQAKAARLADNKTAESEWLDEELALEFDELDDMDFDLELTGFGEDEISEVLDGQKEAEEDDFVAEVDEDEEAEAERGQVYKLGEHRLMCGDATEEGDVDALMDGVEADMVLSDPPYGVTNEEWDRPLSNEDVRIALENSNGPISMFNSSRPKIVKNILSFDPMPERIAVWRKPSAHVGNGMSRNWQPIFVWRASEIGGWDAIDFEFDIPDKTGDHPTQKPIAFLAKWIEAGEGRSVLDLFGGSGSTLIAAEQLDRKCYMMEIDPHYVDVIIDRWEEYTGDTAELVS